jgi:hypothetical protein
MLIFGAVFVVVWFTNRTMNSLPWEPIMPSDSPQVEKVNRWTKIENVSRTVSLIAVPLVIAAVGWVVQRQLQQQAVSKDYVQLSVSILREPNDPKRISPKLRGWAVDLLQATSPVKLEKDVADQLRNGESILPALETFKAAPSSGLSPEDDAKMKAALETFQEYLRQAGFDIPPTGDIRYDVVEDVDFITTKSGEYFSYYDYAGEVLRVAGKQLTKGNYDLVRHEYMRHVLVPVYPFERDPYKDPKWWNYEAISSGLAVYFACSFSSNPVIGPKSMNIDLDDEFQFGERAHDVGSADDVGQKVWGRAFWELRSKIGRTKADKLLASAWVSWKPSDPNADLFGDFARKILEIDRAQGGRYLDAIQATFKENGLAL